MRRIWWFLAGAGAAKWVQRLEGSHASTPPAVPPAEAQADAPPVDDKIARRIRNEVFAALQYDRTAAITWRRRSSTIQAIVFAVVGIALTGAGYAFYVQNIGQPSFVPEAGSIRLVKQPIADQAETSLTATMFYNVGKPTTYLDTILLPNRGEGTPSRPVDDAFSSEDAMNIATRRHPPVKIIVTISYGSSGADQKTGVFLGGAARLKDPVVTCIQFCQPTAAIAGDHGSDPHPYQLLTVQLGPVNADGATNTAQFTIEGVSEGQIAVQRGRTAQVHLPHIGSFEITDKEIEEIIARGRNPPFNFVCECDDWQYPPPPMDFSGAD